MWTEFIPPSSRVGLVLQYLQDRPTPFRGRNKPKRKTPPKNPSHLFLCERSRSRGPRSQCQGQRSRSYGQTVTFDLVLMTLSLWPFLWVQDLAVIPPPQFLKACIFQSPDTTLKDILFICACMYVHVCRSRTFLQIHQLYLDHQTEES